MSEMERIVDNMLNEVNVPQSQKDLKPHERMLAAAIGNAAYQCSLTDDELIASLDRLTGYLRYMVKEGGLQQ